MGFTPTAARSFRGLRSNTRTIRLAGWLLREVLPAYTERSTSRSTFASFACIRALTRARASDQNDAATRRRRAAVLSRAARQRARAPRIHLRSCGQRRASGARRAARGAKLRADRERSSHDGSPPHAARADAPELARTGGRLWHERSRRLAHDFSARACENGSSPSAALAPLRRKGPRNALTAFELAMRGICEQRHTFQRARRWSLPGRNGPSEAPPARLRACVGARCVRSRRPCFAQKRGDAHRSDDETARDWYFP